uniref:Uncharacterized protein n=1 Tax=Anguilla anguilla TaxID=7936 RepID=A0A0E9UBT8_ANGAN
MYVHRAVNTVDSKRKRNKTLLSIWLIPTRYWIMLPMKRSRIRAKQQPHKQNIAPSKVIQKSNNSYANNHK